ncbi:MAG: AsmA family protein [Rubrivivax sp.]
MTAADSPRRWPARLLIGVAALAALLGAAYVSLSLAFPPERLAALLVRQLTAASGRDVSIGGKLSYQVLPRLAVVANDVALANPPGASRPRMLVVERVTLDLAL